MRENNGILYPSPKDGYVNLFIVRKQIEILAQMYRDYENNMMITNRRLDRISPECMEGEYLVGKQNLSASIVGKLDDLRICLEEYANMMRR